MGMGTSPCAASGKWRNRRLKDVDRPSIGHSNCLSAPCRRGPAIQKVRWRRKNRAWRRARAIPSIFRRIGGRGRRGSRKPLYVSAAGCGLQDAADRVLRMHGPHRIPTLVRRADQLFPLRLLIASTAPRRTRLMAARTIAKLIWDSVLKSERTAGKTGGRESYDRHDGKVAGQRAGLMRRPRMLVTAPTMPAGRATLVPGPGLSL